MSAVSELCALTPSEFAAVSTALLPWIDWRGLRYHHSSAEPLQNLLISRLTTSQATPDDPLVSSVLSILATPATTPEAVGLKRPLLYQILGSLPKDRIEPYRAALVRVAMSPTEAEREISTRSAAILEFLDASYAWVPRSKGDDLGMRTLELVQTAEEMRPLVPGMLEWLQDQNWPPFKGCMSQLLRFPEVAIDPIREVLRRGDDAWWENNLLRYVLLDMPRQTRARARGEVERIAQRPTQAEIDDDAWEAANDCLKAMDDSADRAKM